jgi:hypothetical protein
MIEYLTQYNWQDYHDVLYPLKDGVRRFNPPVEMKYCSRTLDNKVVFFKTESDMIAYDNRDVSCLKDERLLARGKYLAGVIH